MLSSLTSYCVWFKLFILFVDLFKVFGEFNVSFDDSDLSNSMKTYKWKNAETFSNRNPGVSPYSIYFENLNIISIKKITLNVYPDNFDIAYMLTKWKLKSNK